MTARGDDMRGRARRMRWRATRVAPAALGILLAGCSSDQVSPVEVSSVTVRAPADSLITGATARFTVEIRDQDGNAVPSTIGVEWSAAPASVVAVDGTGLVTAVAAVAGALAVVLRIRRVPRE